jgi:hypothetical protein
MSKQENASSGTRTYLHYLRLAGAVKSRPTFPALSPNESALFEALTLHWKAGTPLAVRQAMTLVTLGSPSSIHRRILRLTKLDLIEFQTTPKNQIIKLLVPTKMAMTYFDRLGGAVVKAAQSPSDDEKS